MKGKRRLSERLTAFLIAFAMIAGMVMEPVSVSAAKDDEVIPPAPVEENYTVTVNAPSGPFYPGEAVSGFSATAKKDDGELLEGAAITWSCTAGLADITQDGTLTVKEGVDQDTAIEVSAAFVSDKGKEFKGSTMVQSSVRPVYTISGLVQDVFDKGIIKNATITLIPKQAVGAKAEVSTNDNGEYKFENVIGGQGIEYTIICSHALYAGQQSDIVLDSAKTVNFLLSTTETLNIKRNGDVVSVPIGIYVDEGIGFEAECPETWGDVVWNVESQQSAVIIAEKNGRSISLKGATAGNAVLTASAHGLSASVSINVSRIEGQNLKSECKIVKSDKTEISLENKPEAEESLEISAQFLEPDGASIKDGEVDFVLYKKEINANGITVEKEIASSGNIGVKITDGVASWNCTVPYKGNYKLKYSFKGNNKYSACDSAYEFETEGKKGQKIEVDKNAEFSVEYSKVKTYTIPFTASVRDLERAKDEQNWIVSQDNELNAKVVIKQATEDANGFVNVTGEINYKTGKAGEGNISLRYTHNASPNELVYEDAVWSENIKVKQKELKIKTVEIEARVYDGTCNAKVKNIQLEGCEDGDTVEVNKQGLLLTGSDANEQGYPLDTKNAPVQLMAGGDSENYWLNQDIDTTNGQNCGVILRRPVYLKIVPKTEGQEIVRQYGKPGNFEAGCEPAVDLATSEDLESVQIASADTGVIKDNDGQEILNLKDTYKPVDTSEVKTVVNTDIKDLKQYIQVEIDEIKNTGKNYILKTDEKLGARLRIIPLKSINAYDYLNFGSSNGDVYLNGKTLWVKGAVDGDEEYKNNDLLLELSRADGNVSFDGVEILQPEDESIKVGNRKDTVQFFTESDTEAFEKTIQIRLVTFSDDSKTVSVPCSDVFELAVHVDTKAPVVKFGAIEGAKEGLDSLVSNITFGQFGQKTYTAEFSLTDGTGSGLGYGSDNAGISWNAAVIRISDDIQDKKLQTIVDEGQVGNDPIDWAFSGQGSKGSVVIGKEESIQVLEGHYIILVKTFDKLNNSKIYASNGAVLDDHKPIIDFGKESFLPYYNLKYVGENHNVITIPEITVKDYIKETEGVKGQEVASGLKRISYIVYRGGNELSLIDDVQVIQGEKEVYNRNKKEKYTFDELQESQFTCRTFEADLNLTNKNYSKFDGNDIYLRIITEDNAGNIRDKTNNLKIDITRPSVQVEYSNEAQTSVKNSIYFNGNRKAVIKLRDRNLSLDDAKITISLKDKNLSNEVFTLNVQELENLKDIKGEKIFKNVSVSAVETDADGIQEAYITLIYNGEDRYNVDYSCTDKMGNGNTGKDFEGKSVTPIKFITDSEEITNKEFVIDKTAPVVTQTYKVNGKVVSMPNNEPNQYFTQEYVDYTVVVDEHNFFESGRIFGAESETVITRNREEGWNPDSQMEEAGSWQENGINGITEQWKYSYTFKPEGNYTHSFSYEDLAGNKAVYKTDSGKEISNDKAFYTIDRTAPTGTLTIEGESLWVKLLDSITFHGFTRFFNKEIVLEFTGTDDISPILPVQYAKFAQWNSDIKDYTNWDNVTQGVLADEVARNTIQIRPEQQFVAYSKITDKAGNVTYINATEGVVLDTTAPAPKITVTNLSEAQNGIFNEAVSLQIDIEDPTSGETYAGLEEVWYEMVATGNRTTSKKYEDRLNNSANRIQRNKTFSEIFTIQGSELDDFNSNDVKFYVHAVDFAGNKVVSEPTELKIDITSPEISVSWDLTNPLNGRYYKDTRTATISVRERNFDPNNVRFTITNTDGAAASIGDWSIDSAGVSDDALNTCQVSFPSDGDYTFTFGCTDLAGNSAEYGQTDEFTIDKTVPVITVSYDNNNAKNGNYYKEARTATVSIKEHNFNASEVKTAITASLLGQGITSPSVSGFSNSGDVHTAAIKYEADGDYTFDVDYTDLAGNAAADYTQESFTVDRTVPDVEIFDVKDKSANNDVVAPGVKYSDNNYDKKSVSIKIEGANNGSVDIGKVASAITNGESIKLNDFPREEKMDDLYKLTAKVTDKAGNATEKSILFSVNRYGSVYVLDNDTKDWLSTDDEEYTYINQEKELGIKEYNVDDVDVSKITSNRDGELTNLKENTNYTVKRSGSEVQWKEYYYKLAADNFKEEGNYTVTLYSEDKAKNSMNNESVKKAGKKLPLEFTVDKTAPTVVISGVEDGGQYRAANRSMTVDAKDNLFLKEVTVSIDGEKKTYRDEELRDLNGVIKTQINSANKWQDLEITAQDAAGNVLGQKKAGDKAQPMVLAVLVTPNVIVQYYMNKPLFFGSLGVLVALAAVIIVIVMRRKQQNR